MSDYNEKLREDFGRRAKAATQAVADAGITGKKLERFKAQINVINGIIDDNGLMSEAVSALETLELMASNLTSAPAPTGGTPVPASAAPTPPTTPTAPPSGTSKWAPPQATPPAAPAPAPSPAPDWERFIGDLRKTIDPVVEAMPRNQDGQIIPAASQAQVNWLSARTAVLEADMKQMEHTPRKGSDFNFKVAGIAASIAFTAIVIALAIMEQSSGYAFSIAGGISIVIGCIAGALSAGSKSSKKATDTSAA